MIHVWEGYLLIQYYARWHEYIMLILVQLFPLYFLSNSNTLKACLYKKQPSKSYVWEKDSAVFTLMK